MGLYNEKDVVYGVINAYYEQRNVESVLELVTDEIRWIGTENRDVANGKQELKELLEKDIREYPEAFHVQIDNFEVRRLCDDISYVSIIARQIEVVNKVCGFTIRGTAYCRRQKDGTWLLEGMHASVPNAEIEKYSLAKELDEVRRKEQTLLSSIPGGIAIYRIKKSGKITTDYVSDGLAKMCGYTAEEFLELLKDDAVCNVYPADVEQVKTSVEASLSGDDGIHIAYHIYTKAKKTIMIRLDANAMKDVAMEDDDVMVLYAVHSLIPEFKEKMLKEQNQKLQEALDMAEKANKAKTDFLSRVSHDMRTPLNGILGLTSLLQEYVTDSKAISDLSQLEQSGKYLLNLINDTLDVSRIESGKLELHPQICNGRTVFNNILSLIKPNIEKKKLKFYAHMNDFPIITLNLDVGRIEQIVMNLIGNAVKFTAEGGIIDFTMENISNENGIIWEKFIIKDNGIGMSKEFLPHLFEPFSQERNTSTSSSQGTGLGMTITRELIHLMDGEIWVESEEGKGTVCTFTLPLHIATEEQIAKWKETQDVYSYSETLSGRRILLCEDHPLNAMIATRLLENKGMIVEYAENGQIGVDKFAASDKGYYDAVLMDIRMPVLNGIDASKKIRNMNHPNAKTIPIIAMTANAFAEDISETKEAGVNAHLSKPVDSVLLFKTLENLIKNKAGFTKYKVLVVDDVDINRAVIMEAISKDYDVIEAENGAKALEILKSASGIKAIITDIQMPVINGMELIKQVRSNHDYKNIVILASTFYGPPEQEEMLLDIGADDFIYKPMSPKLVARRLHNVMKNTSHISDVML